MREREIGIVYIYIHVYPGIVYIYTHVYPTAR